MTGEQTVASVVITTCDRPDVANRALRSAQRQTHPAVQIIVVDDGDTTPFAVDETSVAGDEEGAREPLVLRTTGREGANRARNMGLGAVTGEYVVFLDDDDELTDDMIETSLSAVAASVLPVPVAAISAMEELVDGEVEHLRVPTDSPRGGTYRIHVTDPQERNRQAAFNTLLAPTAVMRSIGGFDEQIRAAMHTDLFLRLNAQCSLQAVSTVTYRMHHHSGHRLSTSNLARAEGMSRTWAKHRSAYARRPQREAEHLANVASYYLRAGRWRPAAVACARALRIDSRSPRVRKAAAGVVMGPRLFAALLDRRS